MSKPRFEILNDALRLRAEALQIIADCAHWNEYCRKPDERPIDPDPWGQLAQVIAVVENGLRKELLCVHVAGPDEIEARLDLEDAERRATELNQFFDSHEKHHFNPEMRATVQAWPYDAASHAADLVKLQEVAQ